MKNSTRRVSMLLAVMMVLSLFAAFPMMVGAADTNYALGLTPTVTKGTADYTPNTGTIASLTDGVYPTAEGEASRYLGTGASFNFVFNLGSVKTDVTSVYVSLFNVTGGSIGLLAGASVEVSTDGTNYTPVYTNTTGYTLADTANGLKGYAFNFAATSAQYVKVTAVTEKYITSFAEIEIRNYASTGDAADIAASTETPTLVDGNYAYGGTYTAVKVAADGTESAVTYRGATQSDSGTQLTDGIEGAGGKDGTNYKTVSISGTGATNMITLSMSAAKSDVKYITLYNVPVEGTSFCYPTDVSIKVSSDGITYSDVTFTEVKTANADETDYDISYVFSSAVSAQYIQFKWTQVKYMVGMDEFWVGGAATAPSVEVSSEEDSVITADPTVITSPSATNYAPNGYYQYGANTSAFPWTSSTNGDPNFTEAGKYGKGELNDGAYAADNVNNDQAWVAILGSEAYNTINQVELIYDLAAVYGDIDQIVINYYRHAGEGDDGFSAEYAKVNGIKVSFGDYNGTYGAETTVYAGTVTETVNSYGIYKNQYAVGDLTGNVRFVKIVIPKTVYRLVIDEIEIIGASGYNIKGEEPVDPPVSSDPSSSEDPTNPYPYFEPSFELELSAQIGMFDPDGADYTEFTEKEYLAVDITLVDHDDTKYPYGLTSFEGFLYFDEDKLVPAFVTSDHLNGSTSNPKPGPVYSWPTYTETVTIPGVGAYEVVKTAAMGACWAYGYILDDGTIVGADGIPSTETDDVKNQSYSIGLGWTDITFMTENYTAAEGLFVKDNIVFRYYFSAKDGSFDAGESFYFDVDDSQGSDWIGDAKLTGASYAGPGVQPSYQTEVGKSTPITFTVPAETVYYTVTFVDKDGETLKTETVEAGTAATAPEAPAVEGFTFTGWDVDFSAVASDLTVTAQYEQIMVTVTFVAGANGSLTGTTSVSVAYGTDLSAVTFPTAVAADGYEFDAWSATSGALKVDTTVTASFKEIPVAVDHFTFADGADTSNVVVSADGNYIYFKAPNFSANAIAALFADDSITFTKANGTTAVSGTSLVGTTCIVTSTIGTSTATRTIIVLGDINGDGKVTSADYGQVWNCAKNKLALTGAKRIAANVMQPTTDSITAADYGVVKNVASGKLAKFSTAVK